MKNLFFATTVCLSLLFVNSTQAQTLEEQVKTLQDQVTSLTGDKNRLLEEMNKRIKESEEKTKQEFESKFKELLENSNSGFTTLKTDFTTSNSKSENSLKALISNNMPVGTILPFGGKIDSLPDNWRVCDGTPINAVKNKEYDKLWRVIGTSWGGSSMENFSLPDLKGRFLRGVDEIGRVDEESGLRIDTDNKIVGGVVGSFQEDATSKPKGKRFSTDDPGDHNHNNVDPTHGNFNILLTTDNRATISNITPLDDASAGYQPDLAHWPGGIGNIKPAGHHSHEIIGGGDRETRPKNAAVYWIIKVKD